MISFTIANNEYTIDDLNIEAICIFGSYTRGESDSLSDIDILILIEDGSDIDVVSFKSSMSNTMCVPVEWLSVYKVSTFQLMAKKGSYFLWHLKLEGQILYSKKNMLIDILENLNEYSNIQSDLVEYLTICKDIKESVRIDSLTINYELSLLASIIRNTCITISYMDGKYLFGRTAPVQHCLSLFASDEIFSIEDYIDLYKYRISYSRSLTIDDLVEGTTSMVINWLEKAEILLSYAQAKIKRSDYVV